MNIVVYGPDRRVGALVGQQVIDLNRAASKYLHEKAGEPLPRALASAIVPVDLGSFIESGPRAIDTSQKAIDHVLSEAGDGSSIKGGRIVYELSEVKLHGPKPSAGSRIACAGGNYAQHTAGITAGMSGEQVTAQEMHERARAAGMWGFWKVGPDVVGPDEDVIYPARTQRLDYEGEIAIVLGKRGKDWNQAQARDAVWGVTILVDWSIRDGGGQPRSMSFNLGKNFDGCTSLGPCIVVGELDPQDLELETKVNGEVRQHYSTNEMTFSFAEYTEYLARDFTFLPGDIISGGTGAGTALDSSKRGPDGVFPPDRFLKVGDTVEVSSPGIGLLRNRIAAKP